MTSAEWSATHKKHLVPTWPAPNSARIDPAYRWPISTPNCVPRASRYMFKGEPDGGDSAPVGQIDMFPTGPMLMNGQTPIRPDGTQVFLECAGFAPPDVGPQGVAGNYVTFLWTRVGFTPTRATYWSILPWLGVPWHDMGPSQTTFLVPDIHKWNLQVDQLGENPDFTANWSTNFGWNTMSACNLELPGEPMVDDLFAEFNGIDSYISLDQLMTGFNSSFIMSARIRLHDTTVFWPILGREGTGGFFGMDDGDLIFGSLRLPTTWTPVLDEWFDWRYEFEQVLQLKHILFINDIEVMNRTVARQFTTFDNLGVYKHNVSGTLWGNFDMQNLRITSGVPPSPILVLDMPLTVNALDLGPSANHGTPFNMDLPAS